ncbi:hypothetical protein JN27_17815 [Massilia sp. BSC265]|nr:hypothetical protein JN27_17815 [Massilia sp. BSC265]
MAAFGRKRTVNAAQCTRLLPAEQLEGFVRRSKGKEVTLSMRVILNCLAISEYRMDIPALPEAFWEHIEQGLQNK